MKWSYDMDAAKTEPKVLLANAGGVLVSRWLPPGKERAEGRWEFFPAMPTNPPYAWARWPTPPAVLRPLPGMGAVVDELLATGWPPEQVIAEGLATP